MLADRYINLKYALELNEHIQGKCNCDLTRGGTGLCPYGRYFEGMISGNEFLTEIDDSFKELRYGTLIRSNLDDIARIIGIECINEKIYFTLNREVNYYANSEYKNSDRIFIDAIDKHSNILNDLVKVGDIANGHKIIKIENGIFFYGYWGNERISGKITELQSRNDYIKHSFRTF